MKLSNPFIPSLVPASNPARVRTTVIVTLASQAVLLAVLLIQGCKPSVQSKSTPPPDLSAFGASTNTNALAVESVPTNLSPASTNLTMAAPATNSMDLASTNAPSSPLILPPLDTNSAPTASGKGSYTVVSGDSYYKIAKANHISVRALKAANPAVEPHKLKVGQTLNLPDATDTDVVSAAAAAAPDAKSVNPDPAGATTAPAPSAGTTSLVYVVKSGDTLFRIARAQHMSVKELRSLNNLSTDKILLGQKLKLASSAAGSQS